MRHGLKCYDDKTHIKLALNKLTGTGSRDSPLDYSTRSESSGSIDFVFHQHRLVLNHLGISTH